MPIGTAFSYTPASIHCVGWMSKTPKPFYGESIQTMTTAATVSATSCTGTISMHMGRSSKRIGPILIRLRGTLGGLPSASLMTLCPVDRSKFSKSTASRLTRYYRADGQSAVPRDRINVFRAAHGLARTFGKAREPDDAGELKKTRWRRHATAVPCASE